MKNHIQVEDESNSYVDWTLTGDGSIRDDRKHNAWGIELISPINPIIGEAQWYSELLTIWKVLDNWYDVTLSDTCGTHIHLSTNVGWWSDFVDRLREIAKAVVYFERCIDSIMPPHRLSNPFCKSNRYNPVLRSLRMEDIFRIIDDAETAEKLIDIICADGNGSSARSYRWNFTRVADSDQCTVEFRQPPGSICHDDAMLWSNFAFVFIHAAVAYMHKNDPAQLATLDKLQDFLLDGCHVSGVGAISDIKSIKNLFAGKEKLNEGIPHEPLASQEETEIYHAKCHARKFMEMKFSLPFPDGI